MKTEALDLATQMYESSMNLVLSWGTQEFEWQVDARKQDAWSFLSGQFNTFKDLAKEEASTAIQDQIKKIFE